MIDIPKDVINQFNYVDGHLFWKRTGRGRKAGPVGTKSHGYLTVKVNHRTYYVHRIIWAMHHGPSDMEIDHINRDGRDNRIENLRAVSHATNMKNTKPFRNGGVHWDTYRWRVSWKGKSVAGSTDLFEAWCIRKSMELRNA